MRTNMYILESKTAILAIAVLYLSGMLTFSDASCMSCPEPSCMQYSNPTERCKCCVHEFLGKRSDPSLTAEVPALSQYSTFNKLSDVPSDEQEQDKDFFENFNKRSFLFRGPTKTAYKNIQEERMINSMNLNNFKDVSDAKLATSPRQRSLKGYNYDDTRRLRKVFIELLGLFKNDLNVILNDAIAHKRL